MWQSSIVPIREKKKKKKIFSFSLTRNHSLLSDSRNCIVHYHSRNSRTHIKMAHPTEELDFSQRTRPILEFGILSKETKIVY
mmetsp:Transcript_21057/g.58547  ORF Transcript_21057/g.58547 Transcript_21057/m.58547 type:complete len:82 (-) Transcript_21057:149-394(-)